MWQGGQHVGNLHLDPSVAACGLCDLSQVA